MTPSMRKGLIVAVVHVALVASLGAKMLADRAMLPRVWARVAPFDPNLPLRGRYVRMTIEAPADEQIQSGYYGYFKATIRNGTLIFVPAGHRDGRYGNAEKGVRGLVVRLQEPLAFFIPEHIPDPSFRPAGEELWVEVTLPRRGAPRPIRLAIKKDGVLTPLDLD